MELIARRFLTRRVLALLVIGGLLVAFHLAQWMLPLGAPLRAMEGAASWISAPEAGVRGYFRHTFVAPFQPLHAWLSIAADDYTVYVNGEPIGGNVHAINSSLAFQDHISQRSQSLAVGQVIETKRASDLSKSGNAEWRVAHFYDVTTSLVPGRNTIAVYVQSDTRNRFLFQGAVHGAIERLELPHTAQGWRASSVSSRGNGTEWYEPEFDDQAWSAAQGLGRPDQTVFAPAPPRIWTEPFPFPSVTGMLLADGMHFKTTLPAFPGSLRRRSGWIRVHSNWPYAIFAGDEILGSGEGRDAVEVYDISRYLGWFPKPLTVLLQRPEQSGDPLARLAVDGWSEGTPISTRSGWLTLRQPHPRWLSGRGDWAPAQRVETTPHPVAIRLQYKNDIDLAWVISFLLLWCAAAAALGVACSMMLRVLGRGGFAADGSPEQRLAYFLTPALVTLAAQTFMWFRYHESDHLLIFLDPAMQIVWLSAAPAVFGVTLLLPILPRMNILERLRSFKSAPWLLIIAVIALVLRVYHVGFDDLQADENVSWDAARGILRTGGLPQAVSGVYYTRSPLYHYVLALWLCVFGDQVTTARLFSVLSGVAVLFPAYALVSRMTGKRSLGLVTALLLAVDPWQIHCSRIIRFYQQVQFFSVVAVWYFLKGFVWKEGRTSQALFFLACILAILSQEVFITVLPAFVIGCLVFYRPLDWEKDRTIRLGCAAVVAVTLIDMAVFITRCLTQHVGVGISSASIMRFHLSNVGMFWTTFFVGNNRANVFYSLFFVIGLVYWLRRPQPDKAILLLYGIVFLTLATLTVLVMQLAGRYCYPIYPFLIMVFVITADALLRSAASRVVPSASGLASDPVARRRWVGLLGALLVILTISNVECDKLFESYSHQINMQHESALRYIQAHKGPADTVMSVHPMPAAVIFGGIDYYLMEQLSFDELRGTPAGLIDRWAGGHLVSKTDHLRRLFQTQERLWIILDEPESHKISQETLDFLSGSCQVRFEFFGGKVLFWDKAAGLLVSAPDQGGQADSY